MSGEEHKENTKEENKNQQRILNQIYTTSRLFKVLNKNNSTKNITIIFNKLIINKFNNFYNPKLKIIKDSKPKCSFCNAQNATTG